MKFVHDINGCKPALEKLEGGVAAFESSLRTGVEGCNNLKGFYERKEWAVLTVCEREDDLAEIEAAAARIRGRYKALVVIGMGASGRGGSTLVSLAQNRFSGLSGGVKIHFIENTDPDTFDQLMTAEKLEETLFLAISKSGGTAETMAQLLVLLSEVEKRRGAASVKEHFMFISEPGNNAMRKLAARHSIETLDHDPGIGGRFAALTAVGLLPACVAGLDIRAIRRGAADVLHHTISDSAPAPAVGAALHNAWLAQGRTVSVMMPYCDRLDMFGAWHQQLWAESLGKDGYGTTALRSLGATDQHSQLQLYLDGPRDKFVTMILLEQEGKGSEIPVSGEASLSYLDKHTIGDLMEAEQQATAKTLIANGCPVRIFSLQKLDEETIGGLLMHFMLETILMGHIWNIDPFGQPAVEQGKKLAVKWLQEQQ